MTRIALLLFSFFLGIVSMTSSALASSMEIKIPRTSHYEVRDHYQVSLLKFVLEKANFDYTLKVSKNVYSQSRVIESLRQQKVDIYWFGTSAEAERDLHAIRYPIYRGFTGYRVFIIHKESQENFNRVRSLQDLAFFSGIQGLGWSDIGILENAGLKQIEAQYDNIFDRINHHRGDYFSRSIYEVFLELDARSVTLPDLTAEKKVLLVYPFAMFFFTSKQNAELANALEKGFAAAYQDGSFQKFFYNHPDIKGAMERADLKNRTRIDIPNPQLTDATRNIPKEYWH